MKTWLGLHWLEWVLALVMILVMAAVIARDRGWFVP